MTHIPPVFSEHYVEFKKRWDALPPTVRTKLLKIVDTAPYEAYGGEFSAGYALGFNTALEHMLSWTDIALNADPLNVHVTNLKDMLSWTVIGLFIEQYEKALLEDTTIGGTVN